MILKITIYAIYYQDIVWGKFGIVVFVFSFVFKKQNNFDTEKSCNYKELNTNKQNEKGHTFLGILSFKIFIAHWQNHSQTCVYIVIYIL